MVYVSNDPFHCINSTINKNNFQIVLLLSIIILNPFLIICINTNVDFYAQIINLNIIMLLKACWRNKQHLFGVYYSNMIHKVQELFSIQSSLWVFCWQKSIAK